MPAIENIACLVRVLQNTQAIVIFSRVVFRFMTKKCTKSYVPVNSKTTHPPPGQSPGIWFALSSAQWGIWPKMRPARWGIWLSCQNVCQRSEAKGFRNSEAREWRHDSDKSQTNKWWTILKISLKAKAGVPKTLVKQKLRLHSLYFPQKTLLLTESRGEFSDLHSIFRLRAGFDSAGEPRSPVITLVDSTWVFLLLSFYIDLSWNMPLFKVWSEDKLNKKFVAAENFAELVSTVCFTCLEGGGFDPL